MTGRGSNTCISMEAEKDAGTFQGLQRGHLSGGPIWEYGRKQGWRNQSMELASRRTIYAGPVTLNLVLR